MMSLTRITPRRLLLLAILCVAVVVAAVSTLAAVGQTTGPGDDPSQEPIPAFEVPDSAQSIIVEVFFNSPTDVDVIETAVSEWPAAGRAGGPPLISVEVLDDSGGLLEAYNAWHPLWVEHGKEGNDEEETEDPQQGFVVEQSGEGVFIFPFYPDAETVSITDIELGEELIEVDVHRTVVAYCVENGDDPGCETVCVGDVNRDGEVTITDLLLVAAAIGSTPDDSRWNPDADLNGDGLIDLRDLLIVVSEFLTNPECM